MSAPKIRPPCCEGIWKNDEGTFFDILLTVHLSIILAINQINVQNLLL